METTFGAEFLQSGDVATAYGCGGGWKLPPPHIVY